MSDSFAISVAIGLGVMWVGMVLGAWIAQETMIYVNIFLVCAMLFWAGVEIGFRYAIRKIVEEFENAKNVRR